MKKIKADISLGATQKEREDVIKEYMKIQKLLLHFKLSAFAFDPGVKCLVLYEKLCDGEKANYITFDEETWEFIEPLLKELAYLRMSRVRRLKRQIEERKERRKHEVAGKKS